MGCDLTYVGAPGEIRKDAFHGTTLQNALKIRQKATDDFVLPQSGFRPAIGIAGMGCYFDLGNDTSARERALFHADGNLSQATIIQAELHLGKTIDINFRTNSAIKEEFKSWQERKKIQLTQKTFEEQKELFLCEQYPLVNSVFYLSLRTSDLYIAVRDPKRIKILSTQTLDGKVIK